MEDELPLLPLRLLARGRGARIQRRVEPGGGHLQQGARLGHALDGGAQIVVLGKRRLFERIQRRVAEIAPPPRRGPAVFGGAGLPAGRSLDGGAFVGGADGTAAE